MRDHSLRALALLSYSSVTDDRSLRIEPHSHAVLGGDPGSPDAVESSGRICHLDESGKPDSAIHSLRAQLLLLCAQSGVIHHRVDMRETGMMGERLEFDAGWAARRMRIVGDQIAPADFQRIHIDLGGGELDQSFRDRCRNGMADRAVLAHDVLVLEHDTRAGAVIRAGVRSAREIRRSGSPRSRTCGDRRNRDRCR